MKSVLGFNFEKLKKLSFKKLIPNLLMEIKFQKIILGIGLLGIYFHKTQQSFLLYSDTCVGCYITYWECSRYNVCTTQRK